MKLADMVDALTKINLAHPTCVGVHVWYAKESGVLTAKKAFKTDGMLECILPTGERYLGCIDKKDLPCSMTYAERWLTERMEQPQATKSRSTEKPRPPDRRPAQEQRACKAQAKPEVKKAVKKGRK